METGKVEYAPDYKSKSEMKRVAAQRGNTLTRTDELIKEINERQRLEREVIEAAKAYGRAARAVEDHMKKPHETDDDSKAGWRLLRDMESTQEDLMLEALWPLLDFEASQNRVDQPVQVKK